MIVANDSRFREIRSAISRAGHGDVPKTSGQNLAPTCIQSPIRRNSECGLATRTCFGGDFAIGGESAAAVGGIAQIKIAVAFHVMSLALRRGLGNMHVTLVEPCRVDSAVRGEGERVHAVSTGSLVIVYF